MEKEKLFLNASTQPPFTTMGMEIQVGGELNCSSEQLLPNWFLNLNWDNSLDQNSPFESTASVPPSESVVIKEFNGKSGIVCNSGEISQTMVGNGSGSSYTTPLNSPPKLNLSMMDHHQQIIGNLPISNQPNLAPLLADPGFVERAARFSCFGLTSQFGLNAPEFPSHRSTSTTPNLSRVSSSQSLKATEMGIQENKEISPLQDGSASDRKFSGTLSRSFTPDNNREESSVTEQIPNPRKRKAVSNPRGKSKESASSPSSIDASRATEDDDSNAKRCKSADDDMGHVENDSKTKVESKGKSVSKTAGEGAHKQSKEKPKPVEPPKDYIHVRARRGQATDSHSLAERVRREKISERMKFLQDLVPGCNKVTGKAVMLDEIINYVQSLQRQVEFLSMKLATVNPRLDFNMETLLSKDILRSHRPLPHSVSFADSSASAFPYVHQPHQGQTLQSGISNVTETQCSVNPLDATLLRNSGMQLPLHDGFGEAHSQAAMFWEDDLQSVVQMGFGQHQSLETAFQSQSFHGSPPTTHMKVEL